MELAYLSIFQNFYCDSSSKNSSHTVAEDRSKENCRQRLYRCIHNEARSQNITRADVALHAQERKANAVASSNLPQRSRGSLLQAYISLSKKTATPAAEHAAANDRIAVTCIMIVYNYCSSTPEQKHFKCSNMP
ncbi:hypothetical protein ABZP36_024770 [Zizania latifolia]